MFDGLGFQAKSGDFVSLTGKNGSGKSTFLRVLAGFIPASEGAMGFSVDGESATGVARDSFLMVGHMNGLKPAFSLRQNLQLFSRLMTGRHIDDDSLLEAACTFGLAALLDESVQYFSSGQRHRSALTRFCLVPRQIWLMDEPTVGLDAENRQALAGLIQRHIACGGIVIAATHDPMGVSGQTLNMDVFRPTGNPSVDEDWL